MTYDIFITSISYMYTVKVKVKVYIMVCAAFAGPSDV